MEDHREEGEQHCLPVQHILLKLFNTMARLDVGLGDDDEELSEPKSH
jgi:hypothetical protein